jgi:hypothetical protein
MFFAVDVEPYLRTVTYKGMQRYQVKMERKFGEDRLLYSGEDIKEAERIYNSVKE